ncbi:hypothetical protein D9619_011981 [Psilocybe cf. subviscida]|uniref:Uncharacterized protein n=1 Tax=Psilocybe cf. subviscida TaxID=2480587 RepID=A0A8H5B0G1_9AGAR|nr:hypothetical protein D9619_011981 [Psilocybe cf. subviscida]
MLLSPTSPNAMLTSSSKFWARLSRPSLTLVFAGVATQKSIPATFAKLMAVARDWAKPPGDAVFDLRVPVEYASRQAARLAIGNYVYLTGEDSYQVSISGVQNLRVEIVTDALPPPLPVLEMPGTFNLELTVGQNVALDVKIYSNKLDMSRMKGNILIDGTFLGKLEITHSGDAHTMEFGGTSLSPGQEYNPDLNTYVMTKPAVVTKPATAKCHLTFSSLAIQKCVVVLTFSPLWQLGVAWPFPEHHDINNTSGVSSAKYILQVHPGGAVEHPESKMVSSALYYEAIPNFSMMDTNDLVSPWNGFAMPLLDFLRHLTNVLDTLGMSLHARTAFINNSVSAFSAHKSIAYRFLSPSKIAAAVDITVTSGTHTSVTRLFLIFRGISDNEMGMFAGAGEKEATAHNWRGVVGWTEHSKDPEHFHVFETSVLEIVTMAEARAAAAIS